MLVVTKSRVVAAFCVISSTLPNFVYKSINCIENWWKINILLKLVCGFFFSLLNNCYLSDIENHKWNAKENSAKAVKSFQFLTLKKHITEKLHRSHVYAYERIMFNGIVQCKLFNVNHYCASILFQHLNSTEIIIGIRWAFIVSENFINSWLLLNTF